MSLRSFQTLDGPSVVTGLGEIHVVANPVEKLEHEIIQELTGLTVLLDGEERTILGMESWLVPNKIVKAGEPIAVVFKPTLHPLTS